MLPSMIYPGVSFPMCDLVDQVDFALDVHRGSRVVHPLLTPSSPPWPSFDLKTVRAQDKNQFGWCRARGQRRLFNAIALASQ